MEKNSIIPFIWLDENDTQASVYLDINGYCKTFFQKHSEVFEGEGNGYDWENFVESYLNAYFPIWKDNIYFDSEVDTFCMYSNNKVILKKFLTKLKELTKQISLMEEVWNKTNKKYKVYVAVEELEHKKFVLSYVGITTLSLEERLKQHNLGGENFKALIMVEELKEQLEARAYEEVIEELMTNPDMNKEYLFKNNKNSIYPFENNELYEIITDWAICDMKEKKFMKENGELNLNLLLKKYQVEMGILTQ